MTSIRPPSKDQVLFASKVRAARAALGWSQDDLAEHSGVGKRSILRIEQAGTDIRRSTALAIEQAFLKAGLRFEDDHDAGFKLEVPTSSVYKEP